MSLFNGFINPQNNRLIKKRVGETSLLDKIDMLFTDVEIEGKKRGYEKAANEYEKVFVEISKTYEQTKNIIESEKNIYEGKCDKLISKLQSLESEKKNLEAQVNNNVKKVSNTYGLSESYIKNSLGSSFAPTNPYSVDLLDIIYSHKEKKLKEAEQRGYLEAKKIYESKIKKLKDELNALRIKGNREIENMIELISEVVDEITKNQIYIAELKILLKN